MLFTALIWVCSCYTSLRGGSTRLKITWEQQRQDHRAQESARERMLSLLLRISLRSQPKVRLREYFEYFRMRQMRQVMLRTLVLHISNSKKLLTN